jgi:hypothetical protein
MDVFPAATDARSDGSPGWVGWMVGRPPRSTSCSRPTMAGSLVTCATLNEEVSNARNDGELIHPGYVENEAEGNASHSGCALKVPDKGTNLAIELYSKATLLMHVSEWSEKA